MNLRQIEGKYRLYELQVYAAARRGLVHPVTPPGTKRRLYPEWEIELLAELIRSGKFVTPEWAVRYREFPAIIRLLEVLGIDPRDDAIAVTQAPVEATA